MGDGRALEPHRRPARLLFTQVIEQGSQRVLIQLHRPRPAAPDNAPASTVGPFLSAFPIHVRAEPVLLAKLIMIFSIKWLRKKDDFLHLPGE